MMFRTLALVVLLGALSDGPSWSMSQDVMAGRVVGVMDGDTLSLLVEGHEVRIRMANIDAPEKRQPYGQAAKQALSDMAFGKECTATVQTTDRYQRKVSELDCGDGQVNRKMVEQGAAWVYQKYNRDEALPGAQQKAKEARRGLWALPEDQRVAPWLWRHPGKPVAVTAMPADYCKRIDCAMLHSCSDALNALQLCPASRKLDGDRDGKPCEKMCVE